MSNKIKQSILRVVLSVFVVLTFVFGGLLVVNNSKITRLNNQIENLKEVIENKVDLENYVVLTYISEDKKATYLVDKTLELSIYDFLLTTIDFNESDFSSYDGENYYFSNAMTDVEELKSNPEYYEDSEFGSFMVVGLQAVIIDRDYTVVKSGF